jgi:hypothetical protein
LFDTNDLSSTRFFFTLHTLWVQTTFLTAFVVLRACIDLFLLPVPVISLLRVQSSAARAATIYTLQIEGVDLLDDDSQVDV